MVVAALTRTPAGTRAIHQIPAFFAAVSVFSFYAASLTGLFGGSLIAALQAFGVFFIISLPAALIFFLVVWWLGRKRKDTKVAVAEGGAITAVVSPDEGAQLDEKPTLEKYESLSG